MQKNVSQKFQLLRVATSGRQNSAMITDRQNTPSKWVKWPSTWCLVSIFTVRIDSKSFPWTVRFVKETYLPKVFPLDCTLRKGNVPTQIFFNVRCPILRVPVFKTNSTPRSAGAVEINKTPTTSLCSCLVTLNWIQVWNPHLTLIH